MSASPRSPASPTAEVTRRRQALGVHPVYKRIDTCAAEFASPTPYMYSTYESGHRRAGLRVRPDRPREDHHSRLSGPNRIGQGIEFDYCCCHAAFALSKAGYETIMVNCNPETVSTDYDTSDRLYFEPLTAEDVLEIVRVESQRRHGQGRDRAVRRPDAAETGAGARSRQRADPRAPRPTPSTLPKTATASSC